jgi:poly-gamma-glutamate synthesis protein (capsule biosynthesis protein)
MKKHHTISATALFTIIVLACVVFCNSVMISPSAPESATDGPVVSGKPPSVVETPDVPATETPSDSSAESEPDDEPGEEPGNEPGDEPREEPVPEPAPEYFTIAMMGDCSIASEHNSKTSAVSYENVVKDDYAYPFSMVKYLYEDADFTIVNLECVIAEYNVPQNKTFRLRANPDYVNILVEGGIDCAALGNNHTMDYGQRGYDETKEILAAAGVGVAPDGGTALFTTESGLTIGVYSKNTVSEANVRSAAATLKEQGAELIIMALHWGDEGSYRKTASQRQIARAAIDAGAHIVMGTHPHTLQETEIYNGGYIYYSLGNWTFGGHNNPRDKDTVLALLTVKRDVDGNISVVGAENIPCSSSGSETINDYRPVPYEIDSVGYNRALSKLDGSFTGPNLVVSYEEITTGGAAEQQDGGQPDTGQQNGGQSNETPEQPEAGQPDGEGNEASDAEATSENSDH